MNRDRIKFLRFEAPDDSALDSLATWLAADKPAQPQVPVTQPRLELVEKVQP